MKTEPWDAGMTSWLDLMTTDLEGAKAFYGQLLGWDYEAEPMPGGSPGEYTVATLDGGALGGVNELMASQLEEGMPPSWFVYFSVEDVDAAVALAIEAGGEVVHEAFDVPDTGRMAILTDPTGASFCIWQRNSPRKGQDEFEGRPGSFCWAELGTNDVDRAGSFYTRVLGVQAEVKPMSIGAYTVFNAGDKAASGMYAFPPEMAQVPPHWLTYFVVEDAEGSLKRAETLGGTRACPINEIAEVGKVAIIRDPQGATFALLEPNEGELS